MERCTLQQSTAVKPHLVDGALIRPTESLVCRHLGRLGCPYPNKKVFSDRRNSPSSVSGRRSYRGKLFQIRGPAAGGRISYRGPGSPPSPRWRQRWCVHVGRTQTAAKLVRGSQNAIVSEVKRRQAVQRHLYKLARLAYSRHGAEPAANGSPSKPE